MRLTAVERFDAIRDATLPRAPQQRGLPLVFVHRDVVEAIYEHALAGMPREVFGHCFGFPVRDPATGAFGTYLELATRASGAATPTYVESEPESLLDSDEIRQRTGTTRVCCYHAHPRLGVFQSGTDVANFRRVYPEPYQVAIVVDPTRRRTPAAAPDPNWLGFFAWDADHRPCLLPANHIVVVDERPVLHSAEPVSVTSPAEAPAMPAAQHPGTSSAEAPSTLAVPPTFSTLLAEASSTLDVKGVADRPGAALWQAERAMHAQLDCFEPGLPIVLVPGEVHAALGYRGARAGRLLGRTLVLDGRTFVCLAGIAPDAPAFAAETRRSRRAVRRLAAALLLRREPPPPPDRGVVGAFAPQSALDTEGRKRGRARQDAGAVWLLVDSDAVFFVRDPRSGAFRRLPRRNVVLV